MTSTFDHIAARDDRDLLDRFIAAAEQAGVTDARSAIPSALPALISAAITVGGEEQTITALHAYASDVRRDLLASEAAMPPGLNPGAVTDEHLTAAITAVLGGSIPA